MQKPQNIFKQTSEFAAIQWMQLFGWFLKGRVGRYREAAGRPMQSILSCYNHIKLLFGWSPLRGFYKAAKTRMSGPTTTIECYTEITQFMSFQKCPKMSK